MKFYKDWLSKLAKAYANPNVDLIDRSIDYSFTEPDISLLDPTVFQTVLFTSTKLTPSPLIFIYFVLISLAAFGIVWSLDLNFAVRIVILMLIYLKVSFDIFKLLSYQHADLTELQVIGHQWFGLSRSKQSQALQLIKISNVLGLGYMFKFQMKTDQNIRYQLIWKHNSNSEFLRYCQQLIYFGDADK